MERRYAWALVRAVTPVRLSAPLLASEVQGVLINVLLDPDLGPECDDVGDVVVLHRLADRGQAILLGLICCTPSAFSLDRWGVGTEGGEFGVDPKAQSGHILARNGI